METEYNDREEFDPSLFGFDTRYMQQGSRVDGKSNLDYLVLRKNGHSHNCTTRRTGLKLSLSKSTADFLLELFGEYVSVAPDAKGRLLVYQGRKGNGRKLSKVNGKYTSRRDISIECMTEWAFSKFGNFTHIYFASDIYANGKAVLFTPTGERD